MTAEEFIMLYLACATPILGGYLWSIWHKQKSREALNKELSILYPKPPEIYSFIDPKTGEMKYHIIGEERWEKAQDEKERYLEEQERKKGKNKKCHHSSPT